MFKWYFDIDWKLRLLVALLFIAASTIMLLVFNRIWFWGWAVGAVLLMLGGRSPSEKSGYRF